MNSFKKYFWYVIKNHYVDIKGVATRKEYWMFVLYFWAPLLFLSMSFFLIIPLIEVNASELFNLINILLGSFGFIFIIGSFLPFLAISVRRLHDIGLSGLFLLLNFIPYLGGLVVFIFHLLPSKIENNKYYVNKHNKILENDMELLEKLHSLKEKGVITEEEFKIKKVDLLK